MDILFSWLTRAGVATGVHHSLAPPSSLKNNVPFRLLNLPPELVDLIVNFAEPETLMPLRISCKALEAITFDRFATVYFEHVYCFAAKTYHFRCLKDTLDRSPRLSSRIRRLTLVSHVLDGPQRWWSEKVGRPVPDDCRASNGPAPSDTTQAHYLPDIHGVDFLTVLRALQGVKRLPQEIVVTVHLANMSRSNYKFGHHHHSQKTIMTAIAMSQLKVHWFRLDKHTFDDCDDLWAYDRANLVASMSSLEALEFNEDLATESLEPVGTQLCIAILRGGSKLRQLCFHQGSQSGNRCHMYKLPPELPLANCLTSLTTIFFSAAIIDADSLVQALERCGKSLINTSMSYVALSTNDEDWEQVVRTMLAMPGLNYIALFLVQARPLDTFRFFDVPNSFTWPEGREFEGRERVTEGLQSLLDNHMYF